MVYYQRLGDAYSACSSFGIAGALQTLNNRLIQEAVTAGFIEFHNRKAHVVPLIDGHVLLIPESSLLPHEIEEQIQRISSLSVFSAGKFRLYPFEQLNENSTQELIHLGLSRNFLYGTFFVLRTDSITGKARALCPHANPSLTSNELRSMVLSILGSSGHALGLQNNACFCVFYSHTVIDSELIVTQIARTLLRFISIHDADFSLVGPWYAAKLCDERSGSGLDSFIDSVAPRPQA